MTQDEWMNVFRLDDVKHLSWCSGVKATSREDEENENKLIVENEFGDERREGKKS